MEFRCPKKLGDYWSDIPPFMKEFRYDAKTWNMLQILIVCETSFSVSTGDSYTFQWTVLVAQETARRLFGEQMLTDDQGKQNSNNFRSISTNDCKCCVQTFISTLFNCQFYWNFNWDAMLIIKWTWKCQLQPAIGTALVQSNLVTLH